MKNPIGMLYSQAYILDRPTRIIYIYTLCMIAVHTYNFSLPFFLKCEKGKKERLQNIVYRHITSSITQQMAARVNTAAHARAPNM